MEPQVTVLIPSYNPGVYLSHALESVFQQIYPHWKIIVVDDCSTDTSLLQVSPFLRHPQVTLVKHAVNLGQSKAQNTGLDLVDTPYVVQLDSDDWFLPNTLEVLMREAEKQPPDVAVLSGNIQIVMEERGENSPSYVRKGQMFKNKYDFLLSNSSVWPRCYRTNALRQVGGWPIDDPYEGRYLEDKRILCRLIERYRFYWIDEVLYVHRRHDYNQTHQMLIYNYMIEWNVRDVLKRWGDEFEPVFTIDKYGWKNVVALNPKKKLSGSNH
ncbi:glycosyltransferase family 2 protein [Bacillota bacterium LX-D]|nr:glycosyltransferase family 2 protein [Bacillota bacterium LX-D]